MIDSANSPASDATGGGEGKIPRRGPGHIMRGTLTGIIAEIPRGTEVCEILLERDGARLERIVSAGFISPQEEWMDQSWDEWVALLQGSAALELEGEGPMQMGNGDWVFLPAHTRHRVASTSTDPPCVWLAVHLRRAG